jgi:ubiquinone/menaquinone biosynthesis C-methylase UbiE
MDISADYNEWADTYDDVSNRTRDIEASAIRQIFSPIAFENILEAGCGTGKNTSFLLTRGERILAVDFSQEMLRKAKQKVNDPKVEFMPCDLNQPWPFAKDHFDLVSFSLVLEHIESLDFVFRQAYEVLRTEGMLYLGELHPFKQYAGSKARFETSSGETRVLDCFVHHTSDYFRAASKAGFRCDLLKEWFDDDAHEIPRVLTMVFTKP